MWGVSGIESSSFLVVGGILIFIDIRKLRRGVRVLCGEGFDVMKGNCVVFYGDYWEGVGGGVVFSFEFLEGEGVRENLGII